MKMMDDPISFEVIKNALESCAREMSQALRRTAFSPNIKERRDCSCAIFDNAGNLVAQSKDIPVHLGAMPLSVKACIEQVGNEMRQCTMALLNDPFSGGSHLPDLTLVAPVYDGSSRVAFVANRAHHADVGGASPGSMPGTSTSIDDEGILIRPRVVVRDNELVLDFIDDLLSVTRTPDERLGDLSAQVAANNVGSRTLEDLSSKHTWNRLLKTFGELRRYSAEMMKRTLMPYQGKHAEFTDVMDSDGAGTSGIPIKVAVNFANERVQVDFTGTSEQVKGNINCPIASSLSSVYYVFKALFGEGIPMNEGCWSAIDIHVPRRSVLNPEYPAAVAAGNVETSQRIVDTTLGALAQIDPDIVPAASQGTMNNLAIGGIDPRSGRAFSFYETIGGGAGAGRGYNGSSGIHTHMTNTLNTPVESLETEYPLRVLAYSIRRASGGKGRWNGGDGIIREIEVLGEDCTVSIQSERRTSQPWGLNAGEPGVIGRNTLVLKNKEVELAAKSTLSVPSGSIVRIETPGGGGWGKPPSS